MAFRALPEWLLVVAVVLPLAGCTFPLFQRAGVGVGWSLLSAAACGVTVLGVFALVNRMRDAIDRRRGGDGPGT